MDPGDAKDEMEPGTAILRDVGEARPEFGDTMVSREGDVTANKEDVD
jgi:hypothetical protein